MATIKNYARQVPSNSRVLKRNVLGRWLHFARASARTGFIRGSVCCRGSWGSDLFGCFDKAAGNGRAKASCPGFVGDDWK